MDIKGFKSRDGSKHQYDYNALANKPDVVSGKDGGYYTPAVTQLDEKTVQFDFTPSKEGMPAVESVTVELPVGEDSGENLNLTVETITVDEESGGSVPVTGLVLDYTNASLTVGETMHLACSVVPSNATNTAVTWESSDSTIVEVDGGRLTALAPGDAVITARSVENPGITATCAVTVVAAEGGGDDSGGTPAGKIQLATMPIVDGSLVKLDGSVVAVSANAHYAEIPYSDSMEVSTGWNKSWNAYPPFVIKRTDGTYAVPEYTQADTTITCGTNVWSYQCTATLSGYTAEKVYINMQYKPGFDTTSVDAFYYIPGGES